MLAVEAGAGLGLPCSAALPDLALASKTGLEAALLNKFLASTVHQRGWENTNTKKPASWNHMFFIAMPEPTWCIFIIQMCILAVLCYDIKKNPTTIDNM